VLVEGKSLDIATQGSMRNVEMLGRARRVPVGREKGCEDALARFCRVFLDELPPRCSTV
jgi:hypothetical protein